MTSKNLLETKSILAKLMASENITVRHAKSPTAYFDTKKRVLTCPMWVDMNGDLYDLLMGHEVGHALFTPMAGWHDALFTDGKYNGKKFKSFLNVCEDARIEKLIKRKYPGLSKSFLKAYQNLHEKDFFNIQQCNGDYRRLNLIDRINIHFKMGIFAHVQFTKQEQVLVDRVSKLETWDDVIAVTKAVWDYVKANENHKPKTSKDLAPPPIQQEEQKQSASSSQDNDDNEEEDGDEDFDTEEADDNEGVSSEDDGGKSVKSKSEQKKSEEKEKSDKDEKSEETISDKKPGKTESEIESDPSEDQAKPQSDGQMPESDQKEKSTKQQPEEDPMSLTDNSFRAREDELVNEKASTLFFVELPDVDLKKVIVPNLRYIEGLKKGFKESIERSNQPNVDVALISNQLVANFLRRNKSYISLLTQQFEMRKNADQYARQRISKTGELDTKKLDRYKFTNDIFRKVTTVDKGKSHGMVMVVDFSGSMCSMMRQVIEQVLILSSFCKKVNIPFEVYSFTDQGSQYFRESPEDYYTTVNAFSAKSEFQFGMNSSSGFHMAELINSTMSEKQYKEAFRTLLFSSELAYDHLRSPEVKEIFAPYKNIDFHGFHLGGTPFIDMLLASRVIVDNFRNKTHADVINVIHLTDGDGANYIEMPRSYQAMSYIEKEKTIIGFTDQKTRKKIIADSRLYQTTLTKFVAELTGCRHIGYYFSTAKDILRGFKKQTTSEVYEKMRQSIYEDGFMATPNIGYDNYYYVAMERNKIDDLTLDIEDGMSRTKIISAFKKFQNKKRNSRAIATKFATEITAQQS